jgi:hypothetical protein
MRTVLALTAALVTTAACSGPRKPAADCDFSGSWTVHESRVEGTCGASRIHDATLQVQNQGGVYQLQFLLPQEPALNCSGLTGAGVCRAELTCSSSDPENDAELALDIEMTPGGDGIRGEARLQLRNPDCQSTYDLDGERFSASESSS